MNTANSLASRVARLRNLRSDSTTQGIPTARPLSGEWPPGCQAFAASNAQTRLWFLQQLEPGLTAYHMPLLWRLQGELDVRALEQALAALMERHPTLRTAFQLQGSEVLQIIHPPGDVPLPVDPLGDRDSEEVIEAWLEQERRTPFDLTSGVLLRARLLRVAPQEHLLLINHHHIASDGWSRSVLARDLTELYNALHLSSSPQLPPLTVHYQDFAAWQRQHLSRERREQLLVYWRPQLSGLEPLELPGDHPRPATPSSRGRRVSFRIGPELLVPFEALCRSEGATLQMGLLALVALLLHRYSRQEDFAIGLPIWGRNHPDLEPLIGFFINTLPIRTRFRSDQSYRKLLAEVRQTSLAAYDHQELPFERMVEALHAKRDTSRNPLVQVMLQLIELPAPSLSGLEGLAVEAAISPTASARLELEFYLRRSEEGGLKGDVVYATDLFEAERIERLTSHLETLLGSLLADPDAAATSLNLLSVSERQRIERWQQGPQIEVPDLCVHQLFEQQVEQTPEAVALIFQEQKLTYAQLNARANRLAHHLIDLGVGPEVIVGVCLERSVELIVAVLAILKAGGAYMPLDPSYASRRLRETLQDSQSTVVLSDAAGRECLGELASSVRIVALETDADLRSPKPELNPAPEVIGVRPENLAYVIYTSGSTGKPKGVLLRHFGLVNLAKEEQRRFAIEGSSRVLQFASFGFDAATWEWAMALCHGASLVLCDQHSRQSSEALSTLLRTRDITHVTLPPAVLASLPLREDYSLKSVVVAGEACDPSLASAWSAHYLMVNAYGPSEVTVCATAGPIRAHQPLTIGRPIANTQVYILDEQLKPVPVGVAGELYVGGAGIARGYLNRPELTEQRFLNDPFRSNSGARMYKTGDLGCWLPSGEIDYLGRNDFQIKLRGFRIEPGEVEANLLAHPAVAQAVVILRSDDPSNPRLIGYWVGEAGVTVSAEELRGFQAERLPDYMVPAALVELEALPLTSNGKLDRWALPKPSFAGDRERRVQPVKELEITLHGIWAEVLGHGEFGTTDNFFAVGGHSLAAARLVSRIEQALGSSPPLAAVFQNPTIAGLAPLLDRGDWGFEGHEPATAIPTSEPLPGEWPSGSVAFPASYAQARLWFLQQLEPGLTAYHMPLLWKLQGELDVRALEQALAALIERHTTLRTAFQLQGSEVLQIIHPPGAFALAAEPHGDRDSEQVIEGWLEQERGRPFDLNSGVLLRARLHQVSLQEHVLLVNHHHIASDGWSHSVLARDLTELYNAQRTGRTPGLPPLRVQYQDYAAWQRQRLSGEHLRELNEYWIGQLEGLAPLELPSDRPRPAMPSHRGGRVSFQIAADLLGPLEELCRSEGATLQMGLLAVVAVLLHRYSRQEDFVIGVPIWGRNHPDLEPLIGFFINTLPIRTRFGGEPSFRQLLAQVKERSIGAYEHQELPFEQIVEALHVERDTSRNPLVQVMLQLIELPAFVPQGMEGLEVESLPMRNEASKLDLSFYLRRSADGGLRGSITYASDLFNAERIERLSAHLITLITSALEAPDTAVDRLDLLTRAEWKLIESWQEGPCIEVPEVCVHQLFEQQVERTPEATALIFEDQELSYAELNGRANQLAHYLRDLGVGPDEIVGLCLERSVELIVSLLAVLKAGGAYLPLDLNWPESHTTYVLSEGRCRYIIGKENEACKAIESKKACFVIAAASVVQVKSVDNLSTRPENIDGLAYVMFTSGSTGRPKGIKISHRVATLKCLSVCREWGLIGLEVILGLSSFGFDISLRESIFPLTKGCLVVLASESQRLSPAELAILVSGRRITRIQATPSHWGELVSHGLHRLQHSKLIAIGESLTPLLAARLCDMEHVSLLHLYGTTEAPGCAGMSYERLEEAAAISIGKPLHNAKILILDGALRPCPIGVPGELHIGGDGLALGYLNNPELTAEKFIPDPYSVGSSARLYKSGDLASWNGDGTLAFHGRIDQQIKLRGFRIEPGEIEASLLEHGAVAQAVVVLRQDDPANPRLVGYWVAVPEEGASSQELRGFLAERLPEFMVPAVLVELEALPLTGTGKLDRRALPEPSFSGDAEQRVEPATELERQLHGIWAEVLGHGEFGITDNFFAIGGHSLLTMRLKDLVDEVAKDDLPLARYFACPTIALFAQYLQQDARSEGAPEQPAQQSTAQSTPTTWAPMAFVNNGLLPPRVDSFVRQQLVMLSRWPGELAPGHQFVRTIAHQEGLPGFFWCFQGANEYEGLAEALGPGIRLHGMRSAHGLEGSRQIYLNPALLNYVAGIYAREILDLQSPDQPYVVGGNCQAGIIANAVAWHLVAHGRRVRKLILMEPSMSLIRKRTLRWEGDTLILYGTDSDLNPFRHPAEHLSSPQATNGKPSPGESSGMLSERLVRRDLGRAFGRKGYAVAFIPGLHGAFFESWNIPGLARAVRSAVLGSSPEPQP